MPAYEHTDVVIVGGGPTGLLLAAELRRGGVGAVVLERRAAPDDLPRANGLVGQVVRVLDQRGLHAALAGHSRGPSGLLRRVGTGNLGRPRPIRAFGYAGFRLPLHLLPGNPLHVLPVPQRHLEQVFQGEALRLGAELRREHELVSFVADADGVDVEVRGPGGTYRLRAAYLVGCDGAHSAVRKAAGIAFPGLTSRDSVSRDGHAVLAPGTLTRSGALRRPGGEPLRPFELHRLPGGVFTFASFRPGVHLVHVTEWDQPDPGEDVPMSLAELRAAVLRVLGHDLPLRAPDGPGPHVLRRLTARNSRVAQPFRSGRVFVAGDAAHVVAGFGGPGLNLALQDAVNLGWKLAAAVRGDAPAGLLDTYDAERAPQALRMLEHVRAQAALIAPGDEVTARRAEFAARLTEPAVLARLAATMAGSDVPYQDDPADPRIGRLVPDLRVRVGGRRTRMGELLRTGRALLLDATGRADGQAPARLAAPWSARVDAVTATAATPEALLVRPDGYVAWTSASATPLSAVLAHWFGPPAPTSP
ncbi:FAD-dependent oxidoreductase [Catellatospora sp. TT07R-123]|uniref:FAD-dependent monooxygenase n=1 Tax=Catellatospora sp. TT07R-123 TaxID=2733863 RepID=UPI001B12E8F7|nr:FAD-dependent monooxygenase [Catellatospora sp. TT07R-123]GHJ44594.1 FAD-dependent oxidoreductase [Catellatospora sp. TT07R-123]